MPFTLLDSSLNSDIPDTEMPEAFRLLGVYYIYSWQVVQRSFRCCLSMCEHVPLLLANIFCCVDSPFVAILIP